MKQLHIMIIFLLVSCFSVVYSFNNTISGDTAIKIYKNDCNDKKLNLEIDDIYLTKDLISFIFHRNTWIIGSNNRYLYINAFNGKVLKEEDYSNDSFYILPKYKEMAKTKISIGILLLFIINFVVVVIPNMKDKFAKLINFLIIILILTIDITSYIVVYLSMFKQ